MCSPLIACVCPPPPSPSARLPVQRALARLRLRVPAGAGTRNSGAALRPTADGLDGTPASDDAIERGERGVLARSLGWSRNWRLATDCVVRARSALRCAALLLPKSPLPHRRLTAIHSAMHKPATANAAAVHTPAAAAGHEATSAAESARATAAPASAAAACSSSPACVAGLLPFHWSIVRSLQREDGLVILGRGLGVQRVWLGVMHTHSNSGSSGRSSSALGSTPHLDPAVVASAASASASAGASASPELVFLLNFGDDLVSWLNEQLQSAPAAGPHPSACRVIRSINNEYSAADRSSLYLQGGLLSITSRILTVDLLNGLIAPDLICGFCVHDAHDVSEASPEAFILRIWRKKNKTGWIKAMTDDAAACSRGAARGAAGGASFGGLESMMKALFLRKVWLFPRFTISVSESLNPSTDTSSSSSSVPRRFSLDIVELHQPFSELMSGVQSALVEVIDTLITQLKRENQHLAGYEHTAQHRSGGATGPAMGAGADSATSRTLQSLNLSIEAGLLRNFESILRSELTPIQHKLSSKTRSILADLSALRSAISYLINYDCVTFYRYLLLAKSSAVNSPSGHSTWLLSDSAERLFKLAKQRLYTYQPAASPSALLSMIAKRDELALKAKHAQAKTKLQPSCRGRVGGVSGSGASASDAMELSSDDDDATPVAAHAATVAATAASAAVLHASHDSIHLVLEENPKWSLLVDTLEEIEQDVQKRAQTMQAQCRNEQSAQIMRGVKMETTSRDAAMPGPPFAVPLSFGRTLVLVRDSRTATFLTRLLSIGGRSLLLNYWKRYLFSLKLHKRNLANAPGSGPSAAPSGWMAAAAAAAAASASASSSAPPISAAASSSSLPSPPMSVQFAQFQRESALLKQELDAMVQEEEFERFALKQRYANETIRAHTAQDEKQRADRQREEDAPFDLGDQAVPAKRPSASVRPNAAASTAALSVSATSIESLEREVDEQMQLPSELNPPSNLAANAAAAPDRSSTLQSPPQLVMEPRADTRGKRGPKASTATGKRRKVDPPGQPPVDGEATEHSDDEAPPSAAASPSSVDAGDIDADLLLDDEEAQAEAAAVASVASSSAPATASAASVGGMLGGSSSLLFDRSDFSITDARFQMSSVHANTPNAPATSPFFPAAPLPDVPSAASLSSSSTVSVLPSFHVLVHPMQGVHSLLSRYCPEYVILFDPDIASIRELELFQSLPSTDWQLHVYFLCYSNSIEETRYVSSIEQENKAFESLIQTKKNMLIPLDQDGKMSAPDAHTPTKEDRKAASLYEDGTRNATYEAYAATLPTASDTRRGGSSHETAGVILVDVREFRSSLPSQLHAAHLVVHPLTLEIADYILTPTLAVERKSLPDLIGSLASGRLYKQMESAIRYYKTPVLLIEFDRSRPFMLQSPADLPSEISNKNVLSKLVLLVLHFPQMRLVWSRDSHATARIFIALKQKQQQPTIEQAVVAHSHHAKTTQAGYEFGQTDEAALTCVVRCPCCLTLLCCVVWCGV